MNERAVLRMLVFTALLVMNAVAFAVYGADKQRARAHARRVPERTLLLLAFCGGALGSFLAMHWFRHKTHKWQFRTLVPLFLVLQVALVAVLAQAEI